MFQLPNCFLQAKATKVGQENRWKEKKQRCQQCENDRIEVDSPLQFSSNSKYYIVS